MTRPLRILLVHPGAEWSTADVEAGLRYGLQTHGVEVIPYRLDQRLPIAHKFVWSLWRMKTKTDPTLSKPNIADVQYHASLGALEMALRKRVDVVLIVTGMFFHPDVLEMMRRAGIFVTVYCTESPYDHVGECRIAGLVGGGWTHERAMVPALQAVNPNFGYLPHAWHPLYHTPDRTQDLDVEAHDVVFVGSGFPERIAFFNAIDWTGINLGLYGSWTGLGLTPALKRCVRAGTIPNPTAAALYRRAKIGLNLYRERDAQRMQVQGDSLNPRAYELAACGVFHLSSARAEVGEVFGAHVPAFRTAAEASALLRHWLADPDGRQHLASQLPADVAEASWVTRAMTVLGDLQARGRLARSA